MAWGTKEGGHGAECLTIHARMKDPVNERVHRPITKGTSNNTVIVVPLMLRSHTSRQQHPLLA